MKRKAFTLAEIMIAMGIASVVGYVLLGIMSGSVKISTNLGNKDRVVRESLFLLQKLRAIVRQSRNVSLADGVLSVTLPGGDEYSINYDDGLHAIISSKAWMEHGMNLRAKNMEGWAYGFEVDRVMGEGKPLIKRKNEDARINPVYRLKLWVKNPEVKKEPSREANNLLFFSTLVSERVANPDKVPDPHWVQNMENFPSSTATR